MKIKTIIASFISLLYSTIILAAVTPAENDFEIDGDFGSTIQTTGNIADDGHETTYVYQGSGQTWVHTAEVTPYMGTYCYRARCTASPTEDNDRTEHKIMDSWDISDGARYFSLSFYVPSTVSHDNWFFFCQWWQNALGRQPPLTIGWANDNIELARRYDGDSYECLYNDGLLVKNQWYHFLIKVGFGLNNSGTVVLWKMNLATGEWEQKYINTAITLGWQYMPDGVTPAPADNFTWKVGTYRGTSDLTTQIYYDNVRYGRLWTHITKDYLTGYHKNVLELQLDEGSGTNAYDSSYYENDGSLANGPIWNNSGVVGKCLQLDGTDDLVRVPVNTVDFDFGNYLTASCWFKSSDSQTNKKIICMDELSTTYKFHLGINSATELQFQVRHPDGSFPYLRATTSSSVLNGQWHHLVATYNRWATDGYRMKLYLDGVRLASGAGVDQPLTRGANYFYVGKFSGAYFKGYVDEVGLYNYPMTDAEVSSLYNSY